MICFKKLKNVLFDSKLMYPMLFLTVLFINVQASLTQIGQEKERGIKDALSLKGMRKEAFWATWFLVECAVMTTSCVVVVVAAKLVGVIDHTPMYGHLNYRTAARTLFLRPYLAHFGSFFRHFFAVLSVLTPGIRKVAPKDRGPVP